MDAFVLDFEMAFELDFELDKLESESELESSLELSALSSLSLLLESLDCDAIVEEPDNGLDAARV